MITNSQKLELLRLINENPTRAIEIIFRCKCGLWKKQQEIARSVLVERNKKTAVRSCHDAGKSFITARIGLFYLITNEDSIVVTTAPSWTQIREILWREIRSAYNSAVIEIGGSLLTTKLTFGDDWFAIGLATRKEGESSEVAERMLGFHSPTGKILILVDEGSGVEEPIWGAIDGLLTSEGAQLLAIGNPYRKTGSFANLFKSKGVYKIHIRDTDIPNIKENKTVIPGLMSPDYPREMAEKYGADSDIYRIKVRGEFPRAETDTLIPLGHIEDAFLREADPAGEKKLGVDVARYGDNFTVFVVRQGKKVLRKEKHSKKDTMSTAGRTIKIMENEGVDPREVYVDDIGVGGGVVDRLREKGYPVNGVNVGASAKDEEHFANIRAENYWAVKHWIREADLPRDDDFYQLANVKYRWSSERRGQLRIEGKDEMKKRGLDSPDVADALMLTFTRRRADAFPRQGPREAGIGEEGDLGRPETAGLLDREF